jgi:hypothetical protein
VDISGYDGGSNEMRESHSRSGGLCHSEAARFEGGLNTALAYVDDVSRLPVLAWIRDRAVPFDEEMTAGRLPLRSDQAGFA